MPAIFFILHFKCTHTPDCVVCTLDCRGQRTACWGWFFPAQWKSWDWTQVWPRVTLPSGSSWQCLSGLHPSKPCSFLLLGSFICSANDFQGPLCSPGSAPGPWNCGREPNRRKALHLLGAHFLVWEPGNKHTNHGDAGHVGNKTPWVWSGPGGEGSGQRA